MNANGPAPRTTRRELLRLAGLGAVGIAASLGLSGCVAPASAQRLRVAGGEAGGLYQEFATLLADALTRYGVAEQSEALVSEASRENIELIVAGEADLGLALLDTVAASDEVAEGDLVAIGRIYQNYFHCVVRRDGPVRTVADLSGRVIASGAPGSGTRLTGGRILDAAGLTGSAAPERDPRLGLNDGLRALESGEVDAMMISGASRSAASRQRTSASAFGCSISPACSPNFEAGIRASTSRVWSPNTPTQALRPLALSALRTCCSAVPISTAASSPPSWNS